MQSPERILNRVVIGALISMGLLATTAAQAQPILSSWLTTTSTQTAKVREYVGSNLVTTWPAAFLANSNTSSPPNQPTPAQSDIQQIWITPPDVFVYSNDLASHVMGPWYANSAGPYTTASLFGRWPVSNNTSFKFPRTPSPASTKPATAPDVALLVNGVICFNYGDANSYKTAGGTEVPNGDGIWNRLAWPVEGPTFDPANAHQPDSGTYHVHANPLGLRYELNDNLVYTPGSSSTVDSYDESVTTKHHSPILGWAYDGYPIYGPYGYDIALNSGSTVRRMVSGFVLRDGTNGTTENLTTLGRHTLPNWSCAATGRAATLPPGNYGPAATGPGSKALGRYAEDYDHVSYYPASTYVHDLDVYNGRTCVTPEYPGGTYAYFITIDSSGAPGFPNICAGQYYGVKSGGRNTVLPGPATVSFTAVQDVVQDGSTPELNYTINPTKGSTDQAIGRFAVMPSSNGNVVHTSFTVTLGSATGITNLKLYRTNGPSYTGQVQFGSTVASPSGSITFNDSYTTTAATFYWLRGDVSAGASGILNPRLTNDGVTGANPASFGGNDPLSNAPTSFTGNYTWNVNGAGDYQVAANWTPSRTSPATDDILTVDGSVTPAGLGLTNIPSQNVGQLNFINSAVASLVASSAQTLSCAVSIDAGATVIVATNLTLSPSAGCTVNGDLFVLNRLSLGTTILSGSGNLTIQSGATLETKNVDGIRASAAAGAVQCGGRNFDSSATYIYDGSSTQVTGDGLPSTVAGLTANNTQDVHLSGNVSVTGALSVLTDHLVTDAHTLTLGGTANVSFLDVSTGGALYANAVTINGIAVTISSGATYETKHPGGANGQLLTTFIALNAAANYIIDGSAAQVTGTSMPLTMTTLQINNPTTVTLSQALTVTGQLALDQGVLDTNGNALTAPDGNSGITRGTGYVKGALTRVVDLSIPDFRVFPIGSYTYTGGVDFVTAGTGSGVGTLTIGTTDGDAPGVASPSGALDRYWTVTGSGLNITGTVPQLQFHYLQADVSGSLNENTMIIARHSTAWEELTPGFRDTTNNVIETNVIPGFSVWTLANPGAVPVVVTRFSVE